MKRKIFISLNIPEKTKKRLVLTMEKWRDSPPHQFPNNNDANQDKFQSKNLKNWCGGVPVKWTKENNLHLTLAFLGFVPEENILEICEKVRKVALQKEIFDINFDKIALFPNEENPRAIALLGEPNEQLLNLVNDLEKNLGLSHAPKKSFRPHITLGRLRKAKWEALSEKPEIAEKFSLNISADSIDILASGFEEGEREYTLVETCPLK